MTSAAIYGCSGHRLTAEERAFYAEAKPWGFILFRRNVDSPEQVKALVADLRDSVGRDGRPGPHRPGGRPRAAPAPAAEMAATSIALPQTATDAPALIRNGLIALLIAATLALLWWAQRRRAGS